MTLVNDFLALPNRVQGIALGIVLTALSFLVGFEAGWITEVNWLEVFAVFTSYVCTWMCSIQTRENYIWGVITTATYSVLFWQWQMPALALFNLYLVFSLAYGWYRWGSDDNPRPVTNVEPVWYLGYGAAGLVILGLFLLANLIFNPAGIASLNPVDVGLAVASGVAQLLLDNKKLQNWFAWAGINVVSIPFYAYSGLYLVAFQYIFFLANNVIAYRMWKNTMGNERVA